MAKWKCEVCGNEFDNFHAQGFDNRIYCPLCYFKKENQELKLQLKGTTHCFDEEEHEKLKKQLEELKEEKQEWINLLAMFKNQQKEFIKWLEDYLKLFDNMCIDEQGYYDMLEEILNKYKEIIGVSDEKK